MPAVAKAVAADLSGLQPAHKAYFAARAAAFDRSLQPWYHLIASFKARYPGTAVATTEPVGDYLLQAAGTRNLTPFAFQADVMNGVDPAPQYVSLQDGLFSGHKVKVFLYNQQVTDSLTSSFLAAAHRRGSRWSGCTRPCRAGLRLPVLDDGRDDRAGAGRTARDLHREAEVMTRPARAARGAPRDTGEPDTSEPGSGELLQVDTVSLWLSGRKSSMTSRSAWARASSPA